MPCSRAQGITEYHLDNGLRILLFPDHSKPRVTVNLTVFVGSRQVLPDPSLGGETRRFSLLLGLIEYRQDGGMRPSPAHGAGCGVG
jgi:hypothetical protein